MANPYVFDLLLSLQFLIEGGNEVLSLHRNRSNTEGINIITRQNSTDSYENKVNI